MLEVYLTFLSFSTPYTFYQYFKNLGSVPWQSWYTSMSYFIGKQRTVEQGEINNFIELGKV